MDSLKAKSNYNRICQLLINKGGEALRRVLHAKLFPDTLAAALHSHLHSGTLRGIRYGVIKNPQWDLLYPSAGLPDSKKFDITLLCILLRNICGLSAPATGWDAMPPKNDTSISADIVRIKRYRNEVYGHIHETQYDDAKFEQLWEDISKTLRRLLIPREDIANLKEAPLSPEEDTYLKKLKKMMDEDARVCEEVKDLKSEVVQLKVQVNKLTDKGGNSQLDQLTKFDFKGKINDLCEKFQEGTRQWFFDELSTWFAAEESRVMILTAGPGIGKSVLSAKVCQDYSERGKLAGRHFCDFRKSNYSKPSNILQSLASQMCDNVDGFREKLIEILRRNHSLDSLSDAFTVLLNEPLYDLDKREPMLIVVDALDESKTDDKSEFLELISDEFLDLPKWIKILITSRPELQVKKKLEHFKPLEILPQDENQQKDLKCFVKGSLPDLGEYSIDYLVSECEGSFLYAYYMVKELKKMGVGIEPNLRNYAPRGISGFYERQFKRLKTGIQQNDPGIFKAFINVVAAWHLSQWHFCRWHLLGVSLPVEILLMCMNLSDEKYEIRNTIINIMSEILPVYNNCLTVYHKSLTDWLTLDGYKEHEFAADVVDGTKCLWEVCEGMYRVIDSMKFVSDFELSLEMKFALENGGKYLVDVGDTVDFHWLVNVRLNALKFRFCGDLNVDYYHILNVYKSALSNDLYGSIVQHYEILYLMEHDHNFNSYGKRDIYLMYLQFFANAHFNFVNKNLSRNTARNILVKESEMWLEHLGNVECRNTEYNLISSTVLSDHFLASVCSPDKKVLVLVEHCAVKVFELPSLTMIFSLKITDNIFTPTFSPDSSYFLFGSIRSCVCIRKQKEVEFIPGGPVYIQHCSFSSCGKKLVTVEQNFLKVWDVEKRELLVQIEKRYDFGCYGFSSCNKYILEHHYCKFESKPPKLVVRCSKTLEELLTLNQICSEKCPDGNQITLLVSDRIGVSGHYHLSADELVAINPAESFTWKNRRCQILSQLSTLIVYDSISHEVIDRFQIDCLPACIKIDSISKLDGTNFLLSLGRHIFVLSLETPDEYSFVSYVFPHSLRQVTLSPNHLYVACCYYEYKVLTITSVDNGETLETVQLQKPPKACWWSELYLWVVCEGALVSFPHYSGHAKVLGSGREACSLTFGRVFEFGEGVFVFKEDDDITILKIYDNIPFIQKIGDPPSSDATISKDGCAVLLYHVLGETKSDIAFLQYQLWEFTPESGWKLHLDGKIGKEFPWFYVVNWSYLTGTQNCRRLMFILGHRFGVTLYFFDFTSREVYKEYTIFEDLIPCNFRVVEIAHNVLLIKAGIWLRVLNVSDNITITTFPFYEQWSRDSPDIFYLSAKGLFLVVLEGVVKYFKIHYLENCLKP